MEIGFHILKRGKLRPEQLGRQQIEQHIAVHNLTQLRAISLYQLRSGIVVVLQLEQGRAFLNIQRFQTVGQGSVCRQQ